jgi:hypothetical protein
MDFNRGWLFCTKNGDRVKVDLPHDAMLYEKRNASCRNSKMSGYYPGGIYEYEKKFILQAEDLDKSVALLFEGVYQNCTISINGKTAGHHKYGFTEFTVDITDFVKVGENIVSVYVDNSLEPNCRWYTGSGIYRPVSLIIKDKVHISEIQIETVSYSPAVISVFVSVTGQTPITVEIYENGECLLSGNPGDFHIENAKLWGVDHPHLYTCVVKTKTDVQKVDFGIRKIEWDSQTGLLINSEETKLRGGCIHHDNGILGACGFADAEERRIKTIKEAGYNAIRCAHNPASRALLNACDRLGMLVMDESFDGWYIPKNYHDYSRWFDQEYKEDLKAMIEKDRNHPSVIMYSIGNEVSETASQKGLDICEEMVGFVHSLDKSRPVTCGINVLINAYAKMGIGIYKDKGKYKAEKLPPIKNVTHREKKTGSEFFNHLMQNLGPWMAFISKGKLGEKTCRETAGKLDILGVNYGASRYDEDVANYPTRLIVGAESLVSDLPYIWERVKRHKAVIGDFAWAAWDYLGEAGAGSWTYHSYPGLPLLAGSGTIDITGRMDAESYFQRIVWGLDKKPWIGVRPVNYSHETPSRSAWRFTDAINSWNWHGFEGKKAVVEVYCDADIIQLELNGKVLGSKKVKNFRTIFQTIYEPGILVAIAYDSLGQPISRSSLQTGSEKTLLQAIPEKNILQANGQDLCFIPIEFTDEQGCVKPCIEKRVNVTVEGPIKLAGIGSALYKTDEVYTRDYYNAYQGRALAIIRAGYEPGNARVTVHTTGFNSIVLPLEVI